MTSETQPLRGAWTDARVAQLKRLWLDGRSASQVARELRGVTRNAVIGKVHRLGLSGRAAPSEPKRFKFPPSAQPFMGRGRSARPVPKRTRAMPPKPTAFAEGAPSIDAATPCVPLLRLSACGCRFGIGDPRSETFGFCDAPRVRGSFCARHAELAYQPVTPARARADRKLLAYLRRGG